MKRFSFMMVAVCWLTVGAAIAGPVGNTVDPAVIRDGVIWKGGSVGFVLGEESDFVSDRGLKNQASDTELSFNGIKLGLIIRDFALIYALTGMGSIETEGIETDDNFYWGAGATFVAFQHKITEEDWFRIGFDIKYRGISVDINSLMLINSEGEPAHFSTDSSSWDFHEWQIAFATSFQLYAFIPYVGVKYSDTTGDASINLFGIDFSFDTDVDKNFGYFGGISFDIKQVGSVTVEARFTDEQAITIGGMIRF